MLASGFQQLPVRSGKQACRGNTTGARRHGRRCGNATKKPPRRVAEPRAGNKSEHAGQAPERDPTVRSRWSDEHSQRGTLDSEGLSKRELSPRLPPFGRKKS
jgi:hypothetical protein